MVALIQPVVYRLLNFHANIRNVRPHELHLTPKYEDTAVSVQLTADFTGGSIDEMNGEINIDSLQFTAPDRNYFHGQLKNNRHSGRRIA